MTEKLPKNYVADYLSKQISRSCLSASLNYAESIDAESIRDFIHKYKLVLKELRETLVCLQILKMRRYFEDEKLQDENNQLVAIFVASVKKLKARNH